MHTVTRMAIKIMGNMILIKIRFVLLECLFSFPRHGGTCRLDLPHNALLCMKDPAMKYMNGPPLGISPSNLLYEKLMYLRSWSDSKDFGISPNKLFWERSSICRLTNWAIESGISPCNLLCAKERFCKFCKLPILVGMLPEI
ncbi:hypothetical protein L6164_033506 [Bauhinia variegata]|uniref:Uncharacterized protein n=1 Tax=Bauhinia variegata TaxID=167791 RepID=A0ACB9KSG3_BAUVA|nr:hypothetical protein L6164_033506 [Bauhinia variegata]